MSRSSPMRHAVYRQRSGRRRRCVAARDGENGSRRAQAAHHRDLDVGLKGEAQADRLRKGEIADAGHRGGVTRSRDEGSVMALDRGSEVARLYCVGNPKGEDQRG
jgi:hypothetical protein